MLKIEVKATESFNDKTQEFISISGAKLCLEHSLISISKWESKWKKPFLQTLEKGMTAVEFADYVRCMTIGHEEASSIYANLSVGNIRKIKTYMEDSMTATTFTNRQQRTGRKNEIITAELIYYWMIEAGIPFECERWHFNKLMTLLHVCGIKNSGGNKMSKKDTLKEYSALNAARRRATGSKG